MIKYTCSGCEKQFSRQYGMETVECPWCHEIAYMASPGSPVVFRRQHYVVIGNILKVAFAAEDVIEKKKLIKLFSTEFKKDNPSFDEERFSHLILG
jgi:transposase-like protein